MVWAFLHIRDVRIRYCLGGREQEYIKKLWTDFKRAWWRGWAPIQFPPKSYTNVKKEEEISHFYPITDWQWMQFGPDSDNLQYYRFSLSPIIIIILFSLAQYIIRARQVWSGVVWLWQMCWNKHTLNKVWLHHVGPVLNAVTSQQVSPGLESRAAGNCGGT